MKWDLKSVITLILVVVLALITLFLIGVMAFNRITTDNPILNAIVVLYSNSVTMILTYFFTRKKENGNNEQ